MPLRLNIGLNRKVGEVHYGSRGASVNIEVEVDASLVTEPGKLQERIRQLFGLVRTSLAEELNNGHGPPPVNPNGPPADQRSNSPSNPAIAAGGAKNHTIRRAIPSQVKAILAIARRLDVNVNKFLADHFQATQPEESTLQKASQVIDFLRQTQPAQP